MESVDWGAVVNWLEDAAGFGVGLLLALWLLVIVRFVKGR